MKQLYLLLAICLAFIKAEASVIVGYEYFWDTDPGIDNATGTFGSTFIHADSVNITKTISTAGLSAGAHFLYIRSLDSDGKWSLSEGIAVNVVPIIVSAEFFWDTDPGIDNGTGITVTAPSDSVNINILPSYLSTAGLSAGTHFLYVRTKDNFGKWSLSEGMAVNVVPIIVSAEFFWDTDPGIDNGTGINVTASSDSVNINIPPSNLSTAGLSAGIHYFYVRTKDNFGKWSLSEGMAVNVVPIIVDAEFFWDTDPGIDNGTGISVTAPSDSVNINIPPSNLSTAGLSAGIHYFYVRTKDNSGKWSLSEGMAVNVVPILVDFEYFWDTDPGIGNGFFYSVPAFPHLDSVNHTNTISTVGLIGGYHTLYVRTKDSEGKWGLAEGRTMYIQPVITHAEIFWDTDPGIGNAINIPVGTPLDSVNVNVISTALSTLGLSAGTHYFYVRTKDSGNKWSLSEGRAVEVKPYLVKGEYFLNTDPGIGNGTVAFTAPVGTPADSINGNYNISTTGLSYGRYYHYLRTMDNFGKWSLSEPRSFDVIMHITKVEYFIDNDPGVGLGIDIPITADDTVNITNLSIPVTLMTDGWHRFYMRAMNNAGVWTVIEDRPFYIQPTLNTTYTTNTHIEYFVDTDPGVGAATNIPIADADTLLLSNQSIATTGLSQGIHQLYLRAKNSAGVWSVIDSRPFAIDAPPPAVTTITQLEYFYDTDPGVGNALSLALPVAPDDTVNINTNKIAPCLSNGTHYLWLRAKNNLNVWSVVSHDTLNIGGAMIAKPITSLDPDTVCSPSTVTMYADSATGISYQWLDNGTPIGGATFATYTAIVSGNYSLRQTCNASVVFSNVKNVVVNYVPDITICPTVAPVNNDGGLCSAIVTYANATAIGSSPLPVITYSQNSGTAFPVGSTTVYVVATNLCGVDSCQFNVVVADTALPVIANCPANISLNNDAGLCSAIATWTAPTAADNCAIQSFTSSHNSGAAFPVGTTTVNYTATDIHGNVQTCAFYVVVTDAQVPTIIFCPQDIILNNDSGLCTSNATWLIPQASDNCGMQTFSGTHNPNTSFPVGSTPVTYTATDIHGNVAVCAFDVVVTDNELPTITCPAPLITCSASPTLATPVTGDNCAVDTVYNDAPLTFPTGLTIVTWTVEDVNGNLNTCQQSVTVQTVSSAPSSIVSSNGTNICIGNNSVLTPDGGVLGTGANWVLYTGGCGSGLGTTGNSFTVSPTVTTTYYVRAEGACGNTACTSIEIKVSTAAPSQPSIIGGAPLDVCPPATGISLSVTNDLNASSYTWYAGPGSTGISFNPASTTNTQVIDLAPTTNSTYGIRVTASNACGTSAYRGVSIRRAVSTPAAVTGPATVCANSTNSYSTGAVTGATSYVWTAPAGSLFNGSNPTPYTTTSISVTLTLPAGFTSGTVGVAAQVACFTSSVKTLALTSSAPVLGLITGNAIVCPGSVYTYTLSANAAVASYSWTLPAGASGSSATNSIVVTYGASVPSANVCVTGTSVCGVATAPRCKSVAPGIPSQPTSITGPTNGLCNQTINYQCPPQSGVTYNWIGPAGSVINSGQTTNGISITFPTYSDVPAKTLCVMASNSCGTSAARCITVRGAPNTPAGITANPTTWCANTFGIQFTANLTGVSGGYALSWAYPSPSVATYVLGGGNSNSLLLDWLTGNGVVSVTAQNACGSGTRNVTFGSTCREFSNLTQDDNINVYPNPAHNFFNVEFTAEQKENCTMQLMDITGKTVLEQKVNTSKGINNLQVDVEHLAKGLYLLTVSTNKSIYKTRVEVQ